MEKDLELRLRSKCPMVWLPTSEEDRTVPRVQAVAQALGYISFEWKCTEGFNQLSPGQFRQPGDGQCTNIAQALSAIGEYRHHKTVFLVRDMDRLAGLISNNPDYVLIVRQIKDLYRKLLGSGNALVFLANSPVIPPDIEDCMTLVEVTLPNQEERVSVIKKWIATNCPNIPNQTDEDSVHQIASTAAGMTCRHIQSALARSVVEHKALTPAVVEDVLAEKIQVVKTSEILEFVPVSTNKSTAEPACRWSALP